MTVESEVKLRFESADAARQAIAAAGGVVDIPRRVLDDTRDVLRSCVDIMQGSGAGE